jgi:NAD+ synthase (glutamine-hydrolysing)
VKKFIPNKSFMRVATASPCVAIGNVNANVQAISKLYEASVTEKISLVIFPELCITGYSLGDTVRQRSLLQAARNALLKLADSTADKDTAMIVGLPYEHNNRLYNCAAVLADGVIKGLVTKSYLPNYCEFYEQRWYQQFHGTATTKLQQHIIAFGNNILFDIDGVLFGVEICEDMWVPNQPSRALTEAGALIIANLSASPELVGKSDYRKELVSMTSAVERCAYIYCGADWTESTTDTVMSGHALIAENGSILAERMPFSKDKHLLVADIDIDHLVHDRIQNTTQQSNLTPITIIPTRISRLQTDIARTYPTSYFLPLAENQEQKTKRLSRILEIQAHGLSRRILATNARHCVLGLSGGLDSTLALLVCIKAAAILERTNKSFIHTIVMPGPASSNSTQSNAISLARKLGTTTKIYPINDIAEKQLLTLRHPHTNDITYENVQARTRTALLFNYANKVGGIVVGTGDLSELALGWCTYGGDHLSNYNVNASIPKTLVKDLVGYVAELPEYSEIKYLLHAIVSTPISPELTATNKDEISQSTEAILGPYIVHDFFLYLCIRYGDTPEKIAYLAAQAFAGIYTKKQISAWLYQFYERFSKSQFKRSAMPDGPKVGTIALSPRGDWRMPSDMNSALWQ